MPVTYVQEEPPPQQFERGWNINLTVLRCANKFACSLSLEMHQQCVQMPFLFYFVLCACVLFSFLFLLFIFGFAFGVMLCCFALF